MLKLHSYSWLAALPAALSCSQGPDTSGVSPSLSTTPSSSVPVAPGPSETGVSPSGTNATTSTVPGSSASVGPTSVAPVVDPGATATATTNAPTSTTPPVTEDFDPIETVQCAGELPNQDIAGATHAVTAHFGLSRGALPHFWTTYGLGRLGLYLDGPSLTDPFLGQNKQDFHGRNWSDILEEHTLDAVQNLELRRIRAHGLFHDDIGIYNEDAAGTPVFDFTRSDEVFDLMVENDIRPIVELASMPAALAADPTKTVFDWNMIVSPPKDYDKWRQLVQAFVQHSVDRYTADVVNSWDFEVWNEPECCNGKFWGGQGTRATADEYFQLYDASAAGVRAVLPAGRMGGPVTSQPSELVGGQWMGGAGILFLDHLAANGGPLDFFTFHTWSFLDGAINGYFQGLDLLDSYGRNQTQIAVTEFGPTWEFGLRGVGEEPDWEPQETSQGAAFVAQVYADISQRSARESRRFPIAYSWWTLSDIFDEGFEDPEDYVLDGNPFTGTMGLISREGIKKPAYNAYRFLAQMGVEQLDLSAQGPGGVNGLAARDAEGGVQVLVYNGQSPGGGFRDDNYYAVTEAQPVSITIDGLNAETAYDVTAFRVDETHGNAFAVWTQQGRPAMSQMDEAAWQALRDAAESKAEPLGTALCGTTLNLKLDLASPGVLFVRLTPAKL
jgi:xylan 1,4-beta-xylosidase